VVGPSGQEIYTDPHGRAKVQFHWDRLNGPNDHDKKSCWVRVSSQWAGKAWGAISLPRIGQEVVVDFLEGDPDLPLITGRVYNAVQVPPYTLPDHKTVSTLKSQSSIGGTTANANELRFEDMKGSEYIWFQAEKDMRHLVKNNSDTWIKANENRIVGGNLTESVGGKHQLTVDGDRKVYVKGKQLIGSEGDFTIATSATLYVGAKEIVINAEPTTAMVTTLDLLASGDVKVDAGSLHVTAPKIVFNATTQISFKVGGNFVDISSSGVAINGTQVMINSGGAGGSADAAQDKGLPDETPPDLPAQPQDPLTPAA
jgi:type VI secretion system secreted protein VgrG